MCGLFESECGSRSRAAARASQPGTCGCPEPAAGQRQSINGLKSRILCKGAAQIGAGTIDGVATEAARGGERVGRIAAECSNDVRTARI